jgi:pectin methylesterase-like acyl-CoA thioesterase/pectate lyase
MLRRALAMLTAAVALAGCGAPRPGAEPPASTPSTDTRPQLSAAEAARHTVASYLAQGPAPWVPATAAALREAATRTPDLVVAADGGGTHRTLQAALDALPAAGAKAARTVIRLQPGTYREVVCVRGKAPFALVGDAADAAAVRIVFGRWAAMAKAPGTPANPCDPALAAAEVGTAGSASMAVFSDDVWLAHLTIANDAMDAVRLGQGYPPGAGESGGAQAVALMTQGDRIRLHDVRLLGHQDTLYVRRDGARPGRVHVTASLIAGDVDFVFGNATLVVEDSTVLSRAGRRSPGHGGHVFAPSTAHDVPFGFLVIGSRLVAEPGLRDGAHTLGRAWDHGVPRGQWQAGASPNGQLLIRDSLVGPHIGPVHAPWGASTSRRPFTASGPAAGRLREFANRPLPRDLGREILPFDDGWAAAEGGTRGGSAAAPADVHDVRTRAELIAALAPHATGPGAVQRPRIVRVHGRIELDTDARGRRLGEADWRDPAYSHAAFDRAFDPAAWGRRAPEGPLEEARRRSARAQAAHVTVRVPSHTTLVGVGGDAQLAHGMLLLENVEQVIVRNLHFADAFDHFPAWEPGDGGRGEWNSEYDNLSLRNARHVWIDHCSFDDGARPDDTAAERLGRTVQHHDGLLDITQGSDLVTVSWNRFSRHAKTMLIGSGDRRTSDDGKLRVSLHHNWWDGVAERAPRVRYGRVHAWNNLHVAAADGPYRFGYSLGIGASSRLVAEHNAWEGPADLQPARLARVLGGTAFAERGSWLNGRPVDITAALREAGHALESDVGWTPVLAGPFDAAADVPARVRAGAGAGRLAAGRSLPPREGGQ